VSIPADDPTGVGLMRSHVAMLSDGIAGFLDFVRRPEHSGLCLENS
jgi:hypothetical protein